MAPIDVVVLVITILVVVGIIAFLIIRKVKGLSNSCDCGHKQMSGKKLVDEYHKSKESSCCCKKEDK